MNIRNSITAMKDEIAGYRRAMHEHPQTAYEETFASDLVAAKLAEWGIRHERGMAKTGVIATIEGQTNISGRRVGLRADMDALDILEEHNKPWVSKIPGKMHGCGHDGHTAMLLGAAKYLNENRNFDGIVHLIFQPAEEGAGGAYLMVKEGLIVKIFEHLKPLQTKIPESELGRETICMAIKVTSSILQLILFGNLKFGWALGTPACAHSKLDDEGKARLLV